MKLTRKKLKELVRQTIVELSPEGQKAKQMGLVSKGFGNWVDPKSGESFTTKGGKLHKVDKTSSAEAPSGHEPDVAPDDKEKPKQDPQAPSGYEPDIAPGGEETPEEKPEQKPSGPQQAKDLANDPSAWSADSRGTEWDASYRGSSDSAEWEDDYAEAQDDGDEEKLKQIQWFGEKQGWGKDGQMGESLVSKLKREFKEYKVYNKNIRKI